MFHQSHPSITGPAFLIVIAHNVLIVGIRVLSQVPLDQISRLICREPTHNKTRSSKNIQQQLLEIKSQYCTTGDYLHLHY